jgi:hypothetical protein
MKIKSKSGAVIGALIAAGLVSASAATLNGLTTPTLGAETAAVAGCDPDGIEVSYAVNYNTTSQAYDVTAVNLLGVDAACVGQLASVALDGVGPANLTEASIVVPTLTDVDGDTGTDDFTIDLTTGGGADVEASLVLNIAVVIA